MKKILGCLITSFALSPLMSLAVNADAPPPCPTPGSLKNVEIEFGSKQDKGWLAGSVKVDDVYKALVIMMYESSITNQSESIEMGSKIAQAATTVIQHKYYWDEKNHSGSYFWGCDYDVPTDSLILGDQMAVFSGDYDVKGALSGSDHTAAEKIALVRGVRK